MLRFQSVIVGGFAAPMLASRVHGVRRSACLLNTGKLCVASSSASFGVRRQATASAAGSTTDSTPGAVPTTPPAAEAAKDAPKPGTEGEAPTGATGGDTTTTKDVTATDNYSHLPSDLLVEQYSREALKREKRENQIEAVIWDEKSHYPPILARGQQNVYDFTDDIPVHVKPMYYHQLEQQRQYFKVQRERLTWSQFFLRWGIGSVCGSIFIATIMFTRIWLQQPQEVAYLRKQALQPTYGRVLELAAGTGLNVGNYPYAVSEVVMVDSDAASLQRIRYRVPKDGYPKYSIYQDRAEHLSSFKDAEFDCVVDQFGLCHYRDPVMALRQMQRVVKPTGTIVLLEHGRSRWYPVNVFLDYFAERHNVNAHGCAWNRPVLDYVKEARMTVKEREEHHYGTTHYLVAYPELLPEEGYTLPPPSTGKVAVPAATA